MTRLMPDTKAPSLTVDTVGGGSWSLAEQKPEKFTMVVFYRGLHCPVCKGYLQGLDKLVSDYTAAGVPVVAVSMNDESKARQSKEEWGIENLTLGYGLSESDARDWGLYVSTAFKEGEADRFNEPGLFLVRPDGRLYLINISNMPWGRPDLGELLGKINFAVEKNYPARGTA